MVAAEVPPMTLDNIYALAQDGLYLLLTAACLGLFTLGFRLSREFFG
ncbi:hypothetical protein GCM10009840_21100 [Pseudolysinimonas kribbensis]|uniref:ABC transporter permease n=1 Tax=Pseudolysinimonas kribbensis TaxID=433641 RepID=A0ABQ6K307_9MICO|nr:hypothetical protein GCM10025881_01110 [Pseudolysinimonas kribbensis]GMA97188.1 hypothetical protein GCM10025881_40120 [Pseudolysinimonas kribbensis]